MSMMTSPFGVALLMTGLSISALQADPPAPTPFAPLPGGAQPAGAAAAPAAPNASTAGGKIQFADPVYDFGKVKSGDPVRYTYYFTNTGCDVLEVSNVHPSCGCTTAGEWTRKVEAGQSGSIPIQFNSGNYPAGPVFKTITVTSSDKTQPTVVLQLKGAIWKPIDMVPQYAVLNLPPDAANASTVVRIINNTAEPITLSQPEVNNKTFTVTLTNTVPGKEYQLIIGTKGELPTGNMSAQVSIKTSSTNVPVLNLPVWANVQPAVLVTPNQIQLGPVQTNSKATASIMIQNNSTNTLSLSEPSVTKQKGVPNLAEPSKVDGVDVQINPTSGGRAYSVTLSFPEGFEIPPGEQVAFNVHSSNPRFPMIKVPVVQMPKPGVPQFVPRPAHTMIPNSAPPPPRVKLPPRSSAQITPPPLPPESASR